MSYSGAATAKAARENLGRALASLQEDPNIPPDVLVVAQNLAQAVGQLFDAERASDETSGRNSVKGALGLIGQTLALLQDVRAQHAGIRTATETLAGSMSALYPLTASSSMRPSSPGSMRAPASAPVAAPLPIGHAATLQANPFAGAAAQQSPPQPAPPQAAQPQAAQPQAAPAANPFVAPQSQPAAAPSAPAKPAPSAAPSAYRDGPREAIEVNVGATTESNFFVGFSGEISEGGIFAATYNIFPVGTGMKVTFTLPGGFEKQILGRVRFLRDPMDMDADDTVPGMGIRFEGLDTEARELILRFVRKRAPMFFDE